MQTGGSQSQSHRESEQGVINIPITLPGNVHSGHMQSIKYRNP